MYYPPGFLYTTGLNEFKRIVETYSRGDIIVQVYPSGQLGSEREMIEAVQAGVMQMVVTNSAPCAGFVPEINALALPFIYPNWEVAYRVFDGPIGTRLLAKFEAVGIKALSQWNGGPQGYIGHFPVKVPADMKGKKIRVMEDPLLIDTFRALGALPTPIPWNELYTSLQQKVVDGASTCIQMMYLYKFQEIAKHVSFYELMPPSPHLINKKLFDSLPLKYQRLIQSASYAAREIARLDVDEGGPYGNDVTLKNLAASGVTVSQIDLPAFRKAMMGVYEKYEKVYGKELVQAIIKEASQK